MVAYITATVKYFADKAGPNILVNMVSSVIEFTVKDSIPDTITYAEHDNILMRSHDFMIERVHRYNSRYCCWTE